MKKCTVARATQLWKELLKVPSKTAQFVGKETVVVSTNVPDISSNKTRKRLNFFSNSILTEKQKFVPIGFPVDTSSEMSCYSVSPSGNRLCVVRKHPSKEKVQVIDILSKEKLLFTTSFPNLFSDIYFKPPLGGVTWNQSENHIVFVGESPQPEPKSFLDEEALARGDSALGTSNEMQFHWGETLTFVKSTSLFLLDLNSKKCSRLKVLPNIVVGDPHFVNKNNTDASSENVVFVAYDDKLPRQGLAYYNTRPCQIHNAAIFIDENGARITEVHRINSGNTSNFHPRPSPNGRYLAYFATDREDVHICSESLKIYDLEKMENSVLVQERVPISPEDFVGIYSFAQPQRIWTGDSSFLVISSFVRSEMRPVFVAVDEKAHSKTRDGDKKLCLAATDLQHVAIGRFGGDRKSVTPLDLVENLLLVEISSFSEMSFLAVYDIENGEFSRLGSLQNDLQNEDLLQQIGFDVFEIDVNLKNGGEAIFVYPKNSTEKLPLLVCLHGGPHSLSPIRYSQTVSFMCSLGFNVLLVNYRGSIGYGDHFLKMDVGLTKDREDVIKAIENTKRKFGHKILEDEMGIYGGSYGGYLTCALIGDYPDLFKAAVAINPVTNVPMLAGSSDVADWSSIESGLKYDQKEIIDENALKKMLKFSPIVTANCVKTPLLMLLGKSDVRVPYIQNKAYIELLQANDVEVKVLLYEKGTHSINSDVEMKSDVAINTILWFAKKSKRKTTKSILSALENRKELRTIYINDIPQQKLNFADIISFFDKFGEITSVQINKQKSQVFVKYEKQNEAELAMKEAFPVFGDESIRLRWAFFEKQEMSVLENTQEYLFCISKCKERLKTIFGQLENCQKLTKLAKNALKSKNDFGRPENTKILTKLKTLKKSLRGKIENFCRNFPVLDKSNLTFETKPDFWIKIDNNCDLLFDLIAKKFGIEQLYKSDHSVFSVDLRPKILQISNLPKEYLNLNFIKGHFYKYGYITKTEIKNGEMFIEFAKSHMAENALSEKGFLGSTVPIKIVNSL